MVLSCITNLPVNFRLADYQNRPRAHEHHMEALVENLSALEKRLLDSQDIVRVRGKRGRPVPILIPHDIQHVLELITDAHVRAKVCLSESPYVFANFSELFCY